MTVTAIFRMLVHVCSQRLYFVKLQNKQRTIPFRLDKEQALAEETRATLAALDAMRKAHENEVRREVDKFKADFLTRGQHGDLSQLSTRHQLVVFTFPRNYGIIRVTLTKVTRIATATPLIKPGDLFACIRAGCFFICLHHYPSHYICTGLLSEWEGFFSAVVKYTDTGSGLRDESILFFNWT